MVENTSARGPCAGQIFLSLSRYTGNIIAQGFVLLLFSIIFFVNFVVS